MDALASQVSLLIGVDGSKWSQDSVSHIQVGFWLTMNRVYFHLTAAIFPQFLTLSSPPPVSLTRS